MSTQTLKADLRKETGRKVKTLRAKGIIPANVFGKDVKSESVQVILEDFVKVFKISGETGVIELGVGSKKRPVLVSQVQHHPVTSDILHVDFRQVDLTKKIAAMIPLVFVGESPAEKNGVGTVVSSIYEVEVEALPTDFPDNFQIDISILSNVDDNIKIGDIKFDKKKVTITGDLNQVVSRVEPPQKEEVVAAPVTETATTEEAPLEVKTSETEEQTKEAPSEN